MDESYYSMPMPLTFSNSPKKCDNSVFYLIGGVALGVLYMIMSKPSSPMFFPPVHQAGERVAAMFSSQRSHHTNTKNVHYTRNYKTIPMPDSASMIIDAAGSSTHRDAHKQMTEAEKELCEAEVRRIMTLPTPVVVVFFAEWCPHCQDFLPAVAKASNSSSHLVFFVNFDALPQTAFSGHDRVADVTHFPTTVLTTGNNTVVPIDNSKALDIDKAVEETTWQL